MLTDKEYVYISDLLLRDRLECMIKLDSEKNKVRKEKLKLTIELIDEIVQKVKIEQQKLITEENTFSNPLIFVEK